MHTKLCPRCGQEVFDDMPLCYECLFEFDMQEEAAPILLGSSNVVEESSTNDTRYLLRVYTSSVELSLPIPASGLTIGRGSTCDIVLHTPAVSRRHVRLMPCDEGILVTNLDARNLATIGGEEVCETTFLAEDDELVVCGSRFRLLRTQASVRSSSV